MAANRENIFEEKPTLCELCEHIHIGSKWYQLGIMLKLDSKKLNDIQKLPEDSTHKTSKMFELWLDTNPHATRRQVIESLRKGVIEENTVAHEYEKTLRTSCSTGSAEKRVDVLSQQDKVNHNSIKTFQIHSSKLCDAFEADPLRIVNGLIANDLISSNLRKDISSMSGRSYDKASIIIDEIQRQLQYDDCKSTQYLEKLCDFLLNQGDQILKDIGRKMMSQLQNRP